MDNYIFVKDITADNTYHMVYYNGEKIKCRQICLYGTKITREDQNLSYKTLERVVLSIDPFFNAKALFGKYLSMKNIYTYELITKLVTIRNAYGIKKGDFKLPFLIEFYLFEWDKHSIKTKINMVETYAITKTDKEYFKRLIIDDITDYVTNKEEKMKEYAKKIIEYNDITNKLLSQN